MYFRSKAVVLNRASDILLRGGVMIGLGCSVAHPVFDPPSCYMAWRWAIVLFLRYRTPIAHTLQKGPVAKWLCATK